MGRGHGLGYHWLDTDGTQPGIGDNLWLHDGIIALGNEPMPKLRLRLWHIGIDLDLESTFIAFTTGASGDPG